MSDGKREYQIEMEVIDEGGCLIPFVAALAICGISATLTLWLVG